MEKLVITINERYYCAYIPSARSQKYAFDEVEGEFKVNVVSLTADEAPVAFRLSDYSHESKGNTEIRWYQGKLWRKFIQHNCDKREYEQAHVKDLPRIVSSVFGVPHGRARSREVLMKKYREEAKRYLLIDSAVWGESGEPRYVVNTFGLGHNHGGTGLFVEEFYNINIANDRYFSALDGDKAVSEANRIAERRGDTESVGKFHKMIEVLIPEAVTIRPMEEHNEGDPFMNKLETLTEAAPDATTAGLLAMMVGMQEIDK